MAGLVTQNSRLHIWRKQPRIFPNTPSPQPRLGQVEIASKFEELMLRKIFGEAISNLVMSRDEPNIMTSFHDLIPNEMIINFNMLHASMEDRIGCRIFGTHIVAP
jgi:hypothetical protein